MRVSCNSAADFLEVLRNESKVYRDAIHINIFKRPIDGTNKDASKFNVIFQASAVVDLPDGQYLLECGENCGTDYCDSTNELDGTKTAITLKNMILDYASLRGMRVLPGVVGF